ncbi:H-NS histone family protein [bacterium]|nr:H-NS histone family protein [bacterium]
MAGKIDLGKMSMDDLKAHKKDVEKAIAGYVSRKRDEALKEVQAVAKKHGLSVNDLVGGKAKGKKKAAAPAKYRNPADASQTWSGRGRQPAWYKAAVKAGKSNKSLEI